MLKKQTKLKWEDSSNLKEQELNWKTESKPLKSFNPRTTIKYPRLSQQQQINVRNRKQAFEKKHNPFIKESFNTASQVDILESRAMNVLRRLKYKDKLDHLEVIVNQALQLSGQFGYFYVTGANFIYKPENQIKLTLRIHPNPNSKKCIHPINLNTQAQNQSQFYRCLRISLKEIFPTIYLGQNNSYSAIIRQIQQLQQNLTKRIINSATTNLLSEISSPKNPSERDKKILNISFLDFGEESTQIKWKSNQKRQGLEDKIIAISKSIIEEEEEEEISAKEDQGSFTLEDSKSRQNSSRAKFTNKIIREFKQLLNS